ncbi:[FeFe] hydrogenase H-cluster maturation GTPase HydF [Romboutsia sp. 1001713B170207_170306_H8]|uniref:[FeFe] hydrogenase H-cluster maturation GTPase HydF n=1 Tax=Romboutsia sp. 1001713B170207_170306_H8 TaxID=2787112 RepID=UPI00189A7309|nr:[FeFe] hydrogenase H-cluster maturation GTPase HydF [Romboutsia sp. 1001713B170207_170306_H8]
MSLNSTPQSVRVHIGLFGKRNAGKSSVINAITNQNAAIVSNVAGTTTDPVFRPMEILPIGPCVLIDTAGLDDIGELGELRVNKSLDVLDKTDVALLVVDSTIGIGEEDLSLIEKFKDKKIPHILVLNKIDMLNNENNVLEESKKLAKCPIVCVSTINNVGIDKLKECIISNTKEESTEFRLVGDLINENDFIVLVIPIDKAAPKGRLILPQQQVIRDILDSGAMAIITKETTLKETLANLNQKPTLVITDSQAFERVSKDTPKDIPLTSFSILFARQKGDLYELVKGAHAIDNLKYGDKILIAEGCTHHRQSDDIGTYKIPKWLKEKTKKDLNFEFTSGVTFTDDVNKYSLIIHCGGCMMNRTAMMSRIEKAKELNVPIVNYGVLIAYLQGILDRSLYPLKEKELSLD